MYSQSLDFYQLDDLLAENDSEIGASELEGLVYGLLAGGLPNDSKSWKAPVLNHVNDGVVLKTNAMTAIDGLVQRLGGQLEQHILADDIMMPDDQEPLAARLTSLTKWCQGFLLGYGLAIGEQRLAAEDLDEALNDLIEIAQADLEVDNSEESKAALETVIEHVRISAQVIYLETRSAFAIAQAEKPTSNQQIH